MSANDLNTAEAGRVILWNLPSNLNSIFMYGAMTVALAVAAWGIWRRIQLWGSGPADSSRLRDWSKRAAILWEYVLLQRGVNQEATPRLFHSLIFTGFLVLLFTTFMVFIDHDLGIRIYRGNFYLAVTILSDCFGILLLVGVALAYHRRYIQRPDRLHTNGSDGFLLGALALLVVQGYILEALRIHVTRDPWSAYSPIGYLFSLPFWNLSEPAARTLHFGFWWFHTLTVFACIALVPYSKFFHVLASSANLFFREVRRPKGALKFPGDIEKLLEAAAETESGDFSVGVATVDDLTWKQRLDLDSCTSCGRCQDVCPAYRSGKALSPKWLILDSRDHMLSLHTGGKLRNGPDSILKSFEAFDSALIDSTLLKARNSIAPESDGKVFDPARAANPLVQRSAYQVGQQRAQKLGGEVMDEDVFWACTTCRACMEVCPVGIEHVDLILDVRRSMALRDGNLPTEAQKSLRAIETRGNPFGPAEDRSNWTAGLDVRILDEGDETDVLYWVGCISAYDKRKQKIARSVATILNAAGVKWGILGNRECCSGDPARRLGEENLFQTMAKQNGATLKGIKFKTIIANCPHCFNTLKNEYPQVNGRNAFEVMHHSAFIQQLITEGRLPELRTLDRDVTFHDPCYLGRHNNTYDEPREVLVQLGMRSTEMKDNRERGLCCGAGGGHYWFDMKVGERVNVLRTEQAAETKAGTVATGCPFCLQMMEDGAKYTNREDQLVVRDLAELVAEALGAE